jgi:PAS domain S-box-containing protein
MVSQFRTVAGTDEPGLGLPDGTQSGTNVELFLVAQPEAELTMGDTAANVTKSTLRDNLLRLRKFAIQTAVQGMTITDPTQPDNPIVYASPGFTRLTGYEPKEVLGRSCRFLHGRDTDPSTVEQIKQAVSEGRPLKVGLFNYRKDGTPFWNELAISPVIDADGRPSRFVGIQTDATRRRQLEECQRQSHEMESIGQLAGGIAHDVNSMLTIILAYSDRLRKSHELGRIDHDTMVEISKAGERAALMTRQLLAFSRNQRLPAGMINLNTLIRDTRSMLRRVIGNNITISTVLEPSLGYVIAAPGHLAQMLLNLCVFARNAMPSAGRLLLETRNVELSKDYAASHAGAAPGAYVLLAVSAMNDRKKPGTKRSIGEPRHATERPGMGADSGLSFVHDVVKQCNGHVRVESEPRLGTTVSVYLPRADNRQEK